jgi:hypothetical protein
LSLIAAQTDGLCGKASVPGLKPEENSYFTEKNENRMGSLLVELHGSGIRFNIGTGFSDRMRENPSPGSLITFKQYGFYESGIPKFPSFSEDKIGGIDNFCYKF